MNWTDKAQVNEIHHLLYRWDPQPSKIDALQLLDAQFADHKVRALGVQCLESMTDDELRLYMIQLIQAIKFEQHTDSALSRFLLRRSLAKPTTVGRAFFWGLKAEMLGASKIEKPNTSSSVANVFEEDQYDDNYARSPKMVKSSSMKSMKAKRPKMRDIAYSAGIIDENGETSSRVFAEFEEKRLKIITGFYVRNCGSHRVTLGLQMFMMQRFQSCQKDIKTYSVSICYLSPYNCE
jgi:hypothetical protein